MRTLILLFFAASTAAQTPPHQRLADIAKEAQGKVYAACSLPGVTLDCDLAPHGHPPMQSTFKFPLALAVLHQVELGKLQLDQPIRFLKSDRSETFSPLQQEFPEADVDVPLRKIIKLTVETSDNTAADIQLRLIGGPAVLQQYLASLGLSAIHQQDSEHTLHGDQKLQYRDYAEPAAMVALLRLFTDHSPLNAEHTALLNGWMLEATSGPKRIKGLLPAGTPVAHKTGSSGVEWGIIPATNDVGLITLPDGLRLALAVFVIDAHVNQDACEHVIAAIAKAVYDEALAQQSQKPQPLDGPNAVLADSLLDKMVGHWTMTGTLMGQQVTHTVDVEWILNHQFLQIHEVGAIDLSTGKPQYEAMPLIGYDNMSERMSHTGSTLAAGVTPRFSGMASAWATRSTSSLSTPMVHSVQTLYGIHRAANGRWQRTQKNASGQWTSFADLTLRPNENRRSEP